MKNLVPFFTALFLLTKSIAAEQNTSPQIQHLENFALELGHYVKNDWCSTDQLRARTQWADFFNRLILLSRRPQTKETILDFFKQTLFEIRHQNFILYLSEHLDYLNSASLSELQSKPIEAGHWEPYQMAREEQRWFILFGATAPMPSSISKSDAIELARQFAVTYPKPSSFEEFKCDENVTKAIDNLPSLKLGSITMLAMWNVLLAP